MTAKIKLNATSCRQISIKYAIYSTKNQRIDDNVKPIVQRTKSSTLSY